MPEEAKPVPAMAATPWEDELSAQIVNAFGSAVLRCATYLGQRFVEVEVSAAVPLVAFLKAEAGFDYLIDLTAVDHPKNAKRFDLYYILYSFRDHGRVRVKTSVALDEKPATLTPVFPGANWLEREVFDMFGIQFAGHPDLKRILMPEEWNGFPLRKDYGIYHMDQDWVREHLGIESGQ